MKVMITGTSGLLGRALMCEFEKNDAFEIIGTAFSRASGKLHKLDLLDAEAVSEFVSKHKPDVIVHSAAERRPDVSEKDPDGTLRLNINATEHLARLAVEHNAWILYLSTDYVFDGKNPPYKPKDETNPLNFYGVSKRDGEKAIWSVTDDACVLRVPILYGHVETLDESAITVIAKNMLASKGQQLKLDHWATRYPTLVDDVAFVIRQILEHKQKHTEFKGTYHWSGDESHTKYSMAQEIAQILKMSDENFIAVTEPAGDAPRPQNCHLDTSDLDQLGIGKRTPFTVAIREVLEHYLD